MPQNTEGANGSTEDLENNQSTEGSQTSQEAGSGEAGAGEGGKTDAFEGLPEEFAWLKKEVESTRSESAKYRTRAREAEEALKGAKTPEEVAEIQAANAKATAALEDSLARERAVRAHGLDERATALLEGFSGDDIEERAKTLSELIQPVKTVHVTKDELNAGMDREKQRPEKTGAEHWRDRKRRR